MGGISRRTILWATPALAVGTRAFAADVSAVAIDNFAFTPAALMVTKGTVVTWTNRDDIPHQVICLPVGLKSKVLDTDQSASFAFEQAGTFEYFCGLHPHMQGRVTVTG